MNMDKNDLVAFFQELRVLYASTSYASSSSKTIKSNKNTNTEWMLKVEDYLTKDNVDLLDIKRMYRFLDKNVKKEDEVEEEDGEEEDGDEEDGDHLDDL
jgi:hypothetical protein